MGRDYVGTEHILLGLVREKSGNAARALKSVDVKINNARLEVARVAGAASTSASGSVPAKECVGGSAPLQTERLPFNAAAKKLLGAAFREARLLGVDYISTDYILSGLLADNSYSNCAFRVLQRLRVTPDELQEQVQRTATGESVLCKRPFSERLRDRPNPSDEEIYDSLMAAVDRVKAQTDQDKEAADERVNRGLANVLKSLRNARDIALNEQRFELAAWLKAQEQILINKFQADDDGVIDFGKMVQLGKLMLENASPEEKRCNERFVGFDLRALRVFALANEEAYRTGHNHVGAEQILLALIPRDDDECGPVSVIISKGGKEIKPPEAKKKDPGVAWRVFKKFAVTADKARAAVEKIAGKGAGLVVEEVPLNPAAERICDLAREEARRLAPDSKQWVVGTEHLLLALLRESEEGDKVVHKILAALDVDVAELRQEVLRLEPDARLLAGFVAEAIIALAEEETRRSGYDAIGAEQILLALIAEGFGIASRSLKLVGADLDEARAEVEKTMGPETRQRDGQQNRETNDDDLPFAPSMRLLFQAARRESAEIGHGYLGTEHLMLAFLNNRDDAALGRGVEVLQAIGVDLDRLRYEVTSRLMNCKTGETGENFMK